MLKKFLIEKIDHKKLTDTIGSICFHLLDDNGEQRIVRASTAINENNEPQSISSDSIRELPLIETLFDNRHKKGIEIEFDHFNAIYDRDSNQKINPIAYKAVMKMNNKKGLTARISSFFKNNRINGG